MKISRYLAILTIALSCTSCASIMNLDNNKSWRMGIDVVTENPEPISAKVDGKEARFYRLYEGHGYYVDRVIVKRPRRYIQVEVTQNGETKTRRVFGDKTKGLFWFTGLWVLVDHAKGTLRQYPALVFEDMSKSAGTD